VHNWIATLVIVVFSVPYRAVPRLHDPTATGTFVREKLHCTALRLSQPFAVHVCFGPIADMQIKTHLHAARLELLNACHFRLSDHQTLARCASQPAATLFAPHSEWREGFDHAGRDWVAL
jgi:hypothetical protein